MRGEAQLKGSLLQKYLATIKERIENFHLVEIIHIPGEKHTKVDVLSKLASTRANVINHSFVQETLEKPRYGTSAITVATTVPAPQRSHPTPGGRR